MKSVKRIIYCSDTFETVYSYEDYLQTEHWRKIKIEKKKLSPTCELIGCTQRVNLHIHHLTYKNIGHENMEELMTLCEFHHHQVHDNKINKRRKNRKSTRKPYIVGNKIKRLTHKRYLEMIARENRIRYGGKNNRIIYQKINKPVIKEIKITYTLKKINNKWETVDLLGNIIE
jgi:5-methylcytosine-specific restriction endonuclease McrA